MTPRDRLGDRDGGIPRLSDGVAHASRCPASPRRTLLAENLGMPSLGVIIGDPRYSDLLLAGLGACTSMTLRMYAARKGWPLDRISVRLKHDKIHAQDCADCDTKAGRLDRITRGLTLDGELSSEQRARLLEIADKCPVHRSLTSEIKIETDLIR